MSAGRRADVVFVVGVALFLAVAVWFGSGFSFYLDEWRYIAAGDDWSVATLLEPYNQHWSLTMRVVWNTLMATVGLGSHVPYLLVLLLAHVATTCALYVHARRVTHAAVALGLGLLMLLLGAGSTTILFAGALNHGLATAFGAWALVLLLVPGDAWRPPAAAALLLLAVASSGLGLAFLVAAGVAAVVEPGLRRRLWAVLPAGVAFAAWYLLIGRTDAAAMPDPGVLLTYVGQGVAHTVAALTGLDVVGRVIGRRDLLLLAITVVLVAIAVVAVLRRRRPDAAIVASAAGLVGLWAIVGLARAAGEPGSFVATRFVYVGVVFALIAFASWFGGRDLGSARRPSVAGAAVAIVLIVAIGWNLANLVRDAVVWDERGARERAAVAVTLTEGGRAFEAEQGWRYVVPGRLVPAVPGEPIWIPARAGLEALFERYGSPLDDPLLFRGPAVAAAEYDRLLEIAIAGPPPAAPDPDAG